jgi:ubiquitin C-terminal hydrolase
MMSKEEEQEQEQEQEVKRPVWGGRGLENIGNTCFINSCLQVLSKTPELNNILEKVVNEKIEVNQKIDTVLLLRWNQLRKRMQEQEQTNINPTEFIRAIQIVAKKKKMDLFTGYSQNDLPEFFVFLIDCFHNAISREINMEVSGNIESELDQLAVKCYECIKNNYSKEYSEIWKLFYGIQVTQLSSAVHPEKVLNIIPEPYLMLNLPIPSIPHSSSSSFKNNFKTKTPSFSIYDCLDLYVESEVLDGENGIYNEETNEKEPVDKVSAFWSFPDILVMDIKRFNTINAKNTVLIDFPITDLDLSNYVIGYKPTSFVYDLYAVCNHMGNTNGGHYTAFVKNEKGKWFYYDDDFVVEVKDTKTIITNMAYCFFYRKKRQIEK